MLGQPLSMLIPQVIGVRLPGRLPEGATATDLVLTIAELLRSVGVAGTFVEFFGPGVASVPVANRATIGTMSPEYGCTSAIFPIDEVTLDYLRLTGRPPLPRQTWRSARCCPATATSRAASTRRPS
jgi:aconitate hydratase